MNIVKVLAAVSALCCCAMVQAASDDYFACVSTKGPDCYFDGTPVADGEVYALVYTKKGATFAGFQADGTLVDPNSSDIVMLLPQAENGHCKKTLCVVPKTYATATRLKGLWELFLLDTRKADGTPAGLAADGTLSRIRSWGRTDATVTLGKDFYTEQDKNNFYYPSFTTKLSAIPSDLMAPWITGITVVDDKVTLAVDGTKSCFTYNVEGMEELDGPSEAVALEEKDGDETKEITLEANATTDKKFFRVYIDR